MKRLLFILLAVSLVACSAKINTFSDCVDAGGVIFKSVPATCEYQGQSFVAPAFEGHPGCVKPIDNCPCLSKDGKCPCMMKEGKCPCMRGEGPRGKDASCMKKGSDGLEKCGEKPCMGCKDGKDCKKGCKDCGCDSKCKKDCAEKKMKEAPVCDKCICKDSMECRDKCSKCAK